MNTKIPSSYHHVGGLSSLCKVKTAACHRKHETPLLCPFKYFPSSSVVESIVHHSSCSSSFHLCFPKDLHKTYWSVFPTILFSCLCCRCINIICPFKLFQFNEAIICSRASSLFSSENALFCARIARQ